MSIVCYLKYDHMFYSYPYRSGQRDQHSLRSVTGHCHPYRSGQLDQQGQRWVGGDCHYTMIEADKIKMEPEDIKQELDPDGTTGNKPKKKAGRPKKMKQEKITDHVTVVKQRKKVDRFKGMSEEEVTARLLPDHLAPNLDIVIVGINPGLYAAFVGHHYAGPGNHFWKCLYLSGLIPEQMNAMQDYKLLEYGIGFTNIVARTTRGSADLKKKEIQEGAKLLSVKLNEYKPKIAVFNGKGIYEVFLGHKNFYFGKQPEMLPGTQTAVYVMPSSSARCSQLPRAIDKVPFYAALRKFRDHLIGKLPDLSDTEITFPDLELKTVKKEVKKEEPEDQYPGELAPNPQLPTPNGLNNLCQFTPGSYQVLPHSVPNFSQGVYNSSSQGSLPQIKQEPGTSQIPNPPPLQQFDVKIKQEPGVSESESSCFGSSQSNPFSYGQYEQYNQSQVLTQSGDSHLNNFLHGLYSMVDQVDNRGQCSKYGVVQAGTSNIKPVQFNDALCDIVKEGNAFELDPDNTDSPQCNENEKSTKPKSRKRKSKSDASSASPEASSSDSSSHLPSQYHSQASRSPSGQFSNSPTYQQLQPYGSQPPPPPHSQNQHFPSQSTTSYGGMPHPDQPMTSYGGVPHPSQPITSYGGMPHPSQSITSYGGMPHPVQPITSYGGMPPFPQPPSFSYPMGHHGFYQPHQSFSQMMYDGQYFNGMSQNGHVNQPGIPSYVPGSFDGGLNIKQEKPDD